MFATIDQVIARIRAFRRAEGLTFAALAARAGVAPNTVMGLDNADWAPSTTTLRKLESVIPAGFQVAGDAAKKGRAA